MKIGPELVNGWVNELSRMYASKRIFSIDAGKSWIILRFGKGLPSILLSWSSEHSGCCFINSSESYFLKNTNPGISVIGSFLNKHLINATLTNVFQINRDRVIRIEFEKRVSAGHKSYLNLILETTGPNSNIIITDNSGMIMECAKHIHPSMNRYRSILPSHQYIPPPPVSGIDIKDFSEQPEMAKILEIKGIGKDLGRIISSNQNIHTLEEWGEKFLRIYEKPEECFCLISEKVLTFFPEVLPGTLNQGISPLEGGKERVINPMIGTKKRILLSKITSFFEKEIRSRSRHLEGLQKQKTHSEEADKFRENADLIFANLFQLQKGQTETTLTCLKDPDRQITIYLEPDLSPVENAQLMFKKYKKYKKVIKNLDNKIKALQIQIRELLEQKETVELIDDLQKLFEVSEDTIGENITFSNKKGRKKRERPTPPHLKKEIGGFLILVGLNARGNRYVTFEEAVPDDIWFHAYEASGAHVVLKRVSQQISDELSDNDVIEIAASLAAYYSKLRTSGKARVIYTHKKNVRPIKGGSIAQVTYRLPESINISPHLWREVLEGDQQDHLTKVE